MADNHQIHTENHNDNSTIIELSSKKSNVTRKTNPNRINVNNKTSDVASNQSFNNNNNMMKNNVSVGETAANDFGGSQLNSDSIDSLNNKINLQMNDKNRMNVGGDIKKAQHHNDAAGINKVMNAQNNVHSTVSKNSNQPVADHQQKGIVTYDSVNNKTIDNLRNGKSYRNYTIFRIESEKF